MTAPIKAELRHRMSGRIRVALEHPLPSRDALETLAGTLSAARNVEEVEIRPRSGSLIVRHRGAYEDVSRALARAGLHIEVKEHPAGPADPIEQTLSRLSTADAVLQRVTNGRIDIWSAGFSALVGAGLIQLARGQVAGPALTLFGQAATLVMARPLRRFLG
ncbi:hypothetical protein [Novosphingobium mangrovi (ex Huang et al. 2023)]|uniref:HMA domain-containing protein n=1 Tax=Novosphingobium mangrovi (ex Huang et al. 2023) TaxID=2976432 RepID=A0ABT2I1R9_9SPHN|nr:hypothetical protein [Novosphingobium mangrovi (ex Huang et al. 2023)]MCT2398752.1 hypothetical protein [Novosphingobium mangrovi (ex Huang et al. 2023)]